MSFLLRRHSSSAHNPNDRPGPSILLNPEESCQVPPTRSSPGKTKPITVEALSESPTASTSSLTSSTQSNSQVTRQRGLSIASSSKVSFAPLPEVPPELKRRSSITLGVAARKNLLSGNGQIRSQGSGVTGPRPGQTTVYMTDEEWARYKENHSPKTQVIDVGEVAKSGAKSLWRRVRSASMNSNDSSASDSMINTPQSPRRGLKALIQASGSTRSSSPPPASPSIASRLDAVEEEIPQSMSPSASNEVSFDAWAQKSPRGGRVQLVRTTSTSTEGSDAEGSGHNTPTPSTWGTDGRHAASRERNRAILGFDKLALDKNFGGHFGV
ncbi:hypothetical protein BD324DRAFT_680610 [Kockovaella imperatae]|uniref:Uncharacterized protein n=1 Tax=Kockovaella imperatae TaxID=4999 RepID=A0A1Y1UJP5_9TREE|nr:hypothetical protein BD324DRAFT_680610 [Kockovaella imperatae]ORX37724.1 hypothetical protein BD324DRAFT_680610 [Kockovaella imperatae]